MQPALITNTRTFTTLRNDFRELSTLLKKTRNYVPVPKQPQFDVTASRALKKVTKALEQEVIKSKPVEEKRTERKMVEPIKPSEKLKVELKYVKALMEDAEAHMNLKEDKKLEVQKIASALNACIKTLKEKVDMFSPKEANEIKQEWRSLNKKVETLWRRLEIFSPATEKDFIATLWWMIEQGQEEDLDYLWRVKAQPPYRSEEIARLIETAERRICEREFGELLGFFDLNPERFAGLIEMMIENRKDSVFAPLPQKFVPQRPTQALEYLRLMKELLEDSFEQDEIDRWLQTPNEALGNMTPREAMLEGQTFRVLQLLIQFGEGIHY